MLDLDSRVSKFDRANAERREAAKKKREREEKSRLAHVKRERELQKLAAQRRLEQEAEEEKKREAELEEKRLTGGINFNHAFQYYEIEGEDDKVILSEDCLTQLTDQDVFGRGPLIFRLSTSSFTTGVSGADTNQIITHAGVREFTAPAGKIGLPPKLIRCLTLPRGNNNSNHDNDIITMDENDKKHMTNTTTNTTLIYTKYVVLPKCSYVKIQPKLNKFFAVEPVKLMLEQNLQYHSALSIQDNLVVWYRGNSFELIVADIKPAQYCSLVNADVEVDIDLSIESKEKQEQQVSTSSIKASTGDSYTSSVFSFNTTEAKSYKPTNDNNEKISKVVADINTNTKYNPVSMTSLLPEPSEIDGNYDADKLIVCKFKTVKGKTHLRKFTEDTKLSQLFIFISIELKLNEYEMKNLLEISIRFPMKKFTFKGNDDVDTMTLKDAGLNRNEILLLNM